MVYENLTKEIIGAAIGNLQIKDLELRSVYAVQFAVPNYNH